MAYVQQNYPIEAYERKLLAGMLFVMLAFLPTLGFAMYCLSTVSRTENQLNSVYTKTLLLAEYLRTAKVQQDALVPAFILGAAVGKGTLKEVSLGDGIREKKPANAASAGSIDRIFCSRDDCPSRRGVDRHSAQYGDPIFHAAASVDCG